ncbi:tyrosine-type recombinase/integrase, partial [Ramlibacter sp.]|uniref:tyrosine-type recombinase/integrase n=1 Tax=Ramlibacter sp. TaxID=1917967 RepID=UPI001799192C
IGEPIGLRDRAMMEVLYATGIRRMEIAGLEVSDIDFDRQVVLVRLGKGQKDRLVPLGARAAHWVRLYIDDARPQLQWNQQDATLFLGNEGNPLHPMWLSTVIRTYMDRAGVKKKGSCHVWRHTMATLMLEGGADIRHIQAMLGHADISSTQIYAQVAIRQLAQVHAMTHPGVHLRVRGPQRALAGAQLTLDLADPWTEDERGAEGLLEALEVEAREEDEA